MRGGLVIPWHQPPGLPREKHWGQCWVTQCTSSWRIHTALPHSLIITIIVHNIKLKILVTIKFGRCYNAINLVVQYNNIIIIIHVHEHHSPGPLHTVQQPIGNKTTIQYYPSNTPFYLIKIHSELYHFPYPDTQEKPNMTGLTSVHYTQPWTIPCSTCAWSTCILTTRLHPPASIIIICTHYTWT